MFSHQSRRKKRMNNRKQNWFGLRQTKPPTKTAFDECIMNLANKTYTHTQIHTQCATICEKKRRRADCFISTHIHTFGIKSHTLTARKGTDKTHAIHTTFKHLHSQRHYLLITFINMRSTMFSEHTGFTDATIPMDFYRFSSVGWF